MRIIKSTLGYTIAVLCIFIALATFVGNRALRQILIEKTGLTVSPRLTGGETAQVINHDEYRTVIHQPVFQGLIWERDEGFVQIDWWGQPLRPAKRLPRRGALRMPT